MERINNILIDEEYVSYVKELAVLEKDRIYCNHTIEHFLSVARIGRIMLCDMNRSDLNEYIYAAALLHDIGRVAQYIDGTPHDKASCTIGKVILNRCGFDGKEIEIILAAISAHRDSGVIYSLDEDILSYVLYRADKLSRNCFMCEAADTCKIDVDKRNMDLKY